MKALIPLLFIAPFCTPDGVLNPHLDPIWLLRYYGAIAGLLVLWVIWGAWMESLERR